MYLTNVISEIQNSFCCLFLPFLLFLVHLPVFDLLYVFLAATVETGYIYNGMIVTAAPSPSRDDS